MAIPWGNTDNKNNSTNNIYIYVIIKLEVDGIDDVKSVQDDSTSPYPQPCEPPNNKKAMAY